MSEAGSIFAGVPWTGAAPTGFQEAFRVVPIGFAQIQLTCNFLFCHNHRVRKNLWTTGSPQVAWFAHSNNSFFVILCL